MQILDQYDYRRETAERHKQNGARPANSYARFTTLGQGTIEFAQRIKFDLTFIEEPVMSYGCYVDAENLATLQGVKDVMLPSCTGYVTDYDTDDRGFYIGCWIAMRVYFGYEDFGIPLYTLDPTTADVDKAQNQVRKAKAEKMNQAEIKHYFTFAGIGIKDIPLDVTD